MTSITAAERNDTMEQLFELSYPQFLGSYPQELSTFFFDRGCYGNFTPQYEPFLGRRDRPIG